jgi:hypothetical protein
MNFDSDAIHFASQIICVIDRLWFDKRLKVDSLDVTVRRMAKTSSTAMLLEEG